jgi:hypothetical protein
MRKYVYPCIVSALIVSLFGLLLFGSGSCNKAPNNGVPIYLHIDSATVLYNPTFGSSSHFIPDVWVSSGSAQIGAFQTPVDVPILASGNVPIALSGGIYEDGTVNLPTQYEFYAPDTFTIYNAIPGHVYHHKPVYYYYSFTKVALNADFESGNPFTNVTTVSNTADSNVYEGLRSGAIILSSTADSIAAYLTVPIQITTNGRNQSYMEMNYKLSSGNVGCDIGLTANLISGGQVTQQNVDDLYFLSNPIGVWNKIYFNLDNFVGTSSGDYFQIYMTAYHAPGQQDTVFIDNVKLLYFTN